MCEDKGDGGKGVKVIVENNKPRRSKVHVQKEAGCFLAVSFIQDTFIVLLFCAKLRMQQYTKYGIFALMELTF